MNCKLVNGAHINNCARSISDLFTDTIFIMAQPNILINVEYRTTILPAQLPIIVTTEHNEANT